MALNSVIAAVVLTANLGSKDMYQHGQSNKGFGVQVAKERQLNQPRLETEQTKVSVAHSEWTTG